jgi:hypothetical protein
VDEEVSSLLHLAVFQANDSGMLHSFLICSLLYTSNRHDIDLYEFTALLLPDMIDMGDIADCDAKEKSLAGGEILTSICTRLFCCARRDLIGGTDGVLESLPRGA